VTTAKAGSRQIGSSTDRELIVRHTPQGENLYKFAISQAFVQVLVGPLGSAKTTDACLKAIRCINDQPPDKNGVRRSRGLVIRNTTVDLKATTIKDWRSVVDDELGEFKMDAPITHKLRWRHADRKTRIEAEVLFVGFDVIQDVRKLRGYQLTWLWADEAKELPKEVIDMALGRLGRYPAQADVPGGYPTFAMLTSNRPVGGEWLDEILENPPEGWDVLVQPGGMIKQNGMWVPNPEAENSANLDQEYYTRQIGGKTDEWIRQNLGNEAVYVTDGRPVHPQFSQQFHVSKYPLEPLANVPVECGMDWGRTPAAAFFQRSPVNGQIMVLEEITTKNCGIPEFAQLVLRVLRTRFDNIPVGEFWGDPSGGGPGWTDETAFQLMAAGGVEVLPAPCGNNDMAIRTASLDNLLMANIKGEPAIILDPRCQMLIRGLAGAYHYRRLQVSGYQSRYTEKPEKTDESHCCEGLHYGLVGSGEGSRALDSAGFNAEYAKIETDFDGVWAPPRSNYE
jgi:hypothetical protein